MHLHPRRKELHPASGTRLRHGQLQLSFRVTPSRRLFALRVHLARRRAIPLRHPAFRHTSLHKRRTTSPTNRFALNNATPNITPHRGRPTSGRAIQARTPTAQMMQTIHAIKRPTTRNANRTPNQRHAHKDKPMGGYQSEKHLPLKMPHLQENQTRKWVREQLVG